MPLDTNILTPVGWVKLKDIHPGSIVYDEDGNQTRVLKEFYQGEKEVYEITFADATKIECCEDHFWKILNEQEEQVIACKDLTIDMQIPVNKPIQYYNRYFLLSPYDFGQLVNRENNRDVLKQYNIKNYLYSSVDDRNAFLKGLMQAHYIDENHVYIYNNNLMNHVKFLLYSLGYRVSKQGNNIFQILNINTLRIVNIQKLNIKKEMKCITVDSPKHTFICKNFIVTHNTLMMAGLVAKFNVKPVSIFANQISLCTQLKSEFEKFLGEPIGLVGGGYRDVQDITVFSAQSATEEMVKDTKLLLFDECHHLPCNTLNDVSKWCVNAYYRIGVSATPWRSDNSDLLIDAICARPLPNNKVTASELINQGYITPCDIFWVKHQRVFPQKNYNDLYREAIVCNRERNMDIVKIAYQMRNVKDATILILVQRIEHGEMLLRLLQHYISNESFMVESSKTGSNKKLPAKVGEIEFLSGSDASLKRNATIQAFREKLCKILICTTIADEGLDIPSADCLILAGGGKSSTRALQRIGRVLRKYEGKDRAFVYDFRDSTPMLLRQAQVRNRLYKQEPAFNIKMFPMNLLDYNLQPLKH